jgi:hypothetical protein
MTAVHDAVAKLTERLDLLEQRIEARDMSHRDAIATQADRVDTMLRRLDDKPDAHQEPAEPVARPEPDAHPGDGNPSTFSLIHE